MCGLVGYISFKPPFGTFKNGLEGYITQGIYVGGVRGRDSTGMMTLDKDTLTTNVIKSNVDGGLFLDQFNVQAELENIRDYKSIIIHHRKATRGAVNARNAHPFKVGPITLVHNGSIYNHRTLASGNNLTVDSEAIAHALSTHPKVQVMEQLDGAFALIWHDERDNTMNVARNKERPLAFGLVEDEESILIASEKDMLRWLATRNNIPFKMLEPLQDNLFSWDMGNKDVGAKGYTTVPFVSKGQVWRGTGYTAPTAGNSGKKTTSTGTRKPTIDETLSKYSIRMGDTIEFYGVNFYSYEGSPSKGVMQGLDVAGAFETVGYSLMTGDYEGSLCTGTVVGLRETKGVPDWITVIVKDVNIKERDWQKKDNATIQEYSEKYSKEREETFKKTSKTGENKGPKSKFCQYHCDTTCATCREKEVRKAIEDTKAKRQATENQKTGGEKCGPSSDSTQSLPVSVGGASSVPKSFVLGPSGVMIPKLRWEELVKYGCGYCQCDLLEPEDVYWTGRGEPLCKECHTLYYDESYGGGTRFIQ